MGSAVADLKGVMITHKMMLTNICGIQKRIGDKSLTYDDVFISSMPLSDAFEHVMIAIAIVYQVKCVYTNTNILDFQNYEKDINLVKPTFFYAVPGVLVKFY